MTLVDLDDLLAGCRAYRDRNPIGTLPASVIVERDGRVRAEIAVLPVEGSRTILRAATGAARGLAADSIVLTLDARVTDRPINPLTGQPWEYAELGGPEAVPTPDTYDVLLVMRVARDGAVQSRTARYGLDDRGQITWQGELPADAALATGGNIVETLRAAYAAPRAAQLLEDQLGQVLDRQQMQLISDLTTLGILTAQGHVAGLVPTGPEEVAAIGEFMERHGQQFEATVRRVMAQQN